MNAVIELEHLGYTFALDSDSLRFHYAGPRKPEVDVVRPLLTEVRAHKSEAVQFLQARALLTPSGLDAFGPLPLPGVPIVNQSREIESAWWARELAAMGLPDPADVPIDEFRAEVVHLWSERGITGLGLQDERKGQYDTSNTR